MPRPPSREDVRTPQIQYQLLTAALSAQDPFDSEEDAPTGVTDAIKHIQTAMNLLGEADASLDECQPEEIDFAAVRAQYADRVYEASDEKDYDERDIHELPLVDVAHGMVTTAFIFERDDGSLTGVRVPSSDVEYVDFEEVSDS